MQEHLYRSPEPREAGRLGVEFVDKLNNSGLLQQDMELDSSSAEALRPEHYPGFIPPVTTSDGIAEAFTLLEKWRVGHALQQANQIKRGVVRPVTETFPIIAPNNPKGARDPHYSGVPGEIAEAIDYVNRSLYFNETTNGDGDKSNININTDPVGPLIRREVQETLNAKNVVCVLPFVDKEESTVGMDVAYAVEKLGEGRVLAVHSGRNRDLLNLVRESGAIAVSQDDILGCYDWDMLRTLNIIPPYFKVVDGVPAKGPAHRNFTKGLTMLAGASAMEAVGFLDDHDIAWHDTDIQNPAEYDALTHLYIPDTYSDGQEIKGRRIARNGQGRNNEMWQAQANMLGTMTLTQFKEKFLHPGEPNPHGMTDDEFYARSKSMMELSLLLANNTWPLTGERAGSVRDIPFSTGMGIETLIDIYDAGVDVRAKDNTVAQVGNPNQKIENAVVDTKREWMLMNYCADFQRIVVEHMFKTGRMLHEWTIEDISDFNNTYSDMLQTYAVQHADPNAAPYTGLAQPEYILPSIAQIREYEGRTGIQLVDWEKMQHIVQGDNPTRPFVRAVAKAA